EVAVQKLLNITPDYQSVDELITEDQQLAFIKAFREVMRYNAQLQTFIEYDQDQTALDKQHFANFASKYADLCQDRKSTRLNSSHVKISYAVFCLKKKKQDRRYR